MQLVRKAYTTAIIALLTLSLVLAAAPIQPAAASSGDIKVIEATTPDPYPMVNTTYTINFTISSDLVKALNDTAGYINVTFPEGFTLSQDTGDYRVASNATPSEVVEIKGVTDLAIKIANKTGSSWCGATANALSIELNVSDILNPAKAETYYINITAYNKEGSNILLDGSATILKEVTIYEAKLVFIEVPDYIIPGANSTFTVQAQDASGNPINIQGFINATLESNSTDYTFYNSTGADAAKGNWTIIGYNNNQSSFYYEESLLRFNSGATINITASLSGWENATAIIPLAVSQGCTVTNVHVRDKLVIANATGATPGGEVKVYWDAVKDWDGVKGYLNSTYAEADGSFQVEITIPEAVQGLHYIYVYDVMTSNLIGGGAFATINVEPKIVISPTVGLPGDTITVEGTGFGEEEVISISWRNDTDTDVLDTTPAEVKTSALGSFEATFEIPELEDGNYTITAKGATTGKSAEATLTVGTYILLTPERGLAGSIVSIVGRGFAPDSTVDVYFGSARYPGEFQVKVLSKVPTDAEGSFSAEFKVPSITVSEPTEYYVTAIDEEENSAEAIFTVTPPASIILEKYSGYPGEEIGISGQYFTPNSEVTLYLDDTVLETEPTTIKTDEDGAFSNVKFVVPEVPAGKYTLKAVDEKGLSATAKFTVLERVIEIKTRSDEYLPGDTISFYIYSTVAFASGTTIDITIVDPDGYTFFTVSWKPEETETGSGIYIVPYYKQVDEYNNTLTLPSDAPLGVWNWTATYYLSGVTAKQEKTGNFTVVERPTLATIMERLDELDVKITTINGTLVTISTDIGDVQTTLKDINATLVSIKDGVVEINTDQGKH